MQKLVNLLLFGGLEREEYYNVRGRAGSENRKTVTLFTLLSAFFFLISAVLALKTKMDLSVNVYFYASGLFILMLLLNEIFHKKFPIISNVFAILYSVVLLCSGVYIAYSQSGERTTMLLPLFLMVALVFCYRPIYLIILSVGVEVVYLIVMRGVQDDSLFMVNSVNTIIFCITGIVGGIFTLTLKYKKYRAEYKSQVLLERDVLTGAYNRLSCEKEFSRIVEQKKPVSICSLDINGVKQVNDSLGHLAGDELIVGAAQCISEVFGEYGNVYRIGGDEFCVLIYQDFNKEALLEKLREKTKVWKGKLVNDLNIAAGIAKLDHDYEERLADVVHEADLQMYAEKYAYYASKENAN